VYLVIKVLLSALVIVAVSELAKRSEDTNDTARVAKLSGEILWLVVPSLLLFALLPVVIKRGAGFYPALGIAGGLHRSRLQSDGAPRASLRCVDLRSTS
jgi:heme/copper-type cytochrome/quinol oxidase subunit 2